MGFYVDYEPRGGARELFRCRDREILLQGPAGTGKSTAVLHYLVWVAETFPNTRILIVRKTRESMSESVLVSLEENVLPPGHPALRGGGRQNRSVYKFDNGSLIALAGMDKPTRLYSSEYAIVYVEECNELTEHEWESLKRALRWKSIPLGTYDKKGRMRYLRQLIGCCNPDSDQHWLVKRKRRIEDGVWVGRTTWLQSNHEDNPSLDEDYLEELANLTGVRRKRLYEGIWCAAEGMIWENFDRDIHHIIAPRTEDGEIDRAALGLRWFFGSIDWGYTKPGTFQVWGVDKHNRLVLVEETYHTGKLLDFWGDVIATAHKKWDLRTVVADPEDKGNMEQINQWIGPLAGRDSPWLLEGANNTVHTGLDQVRWGLGKDKHGVPRIRICRDILRFGRDPELVKKHRPTCVVDEIGEYVYATHTPGKEVLRAKAYELPDKKCEDHGCDAMRYAAMFAWGVDLARMPVEEDPKPGTMGHLLDHAAAWRKIKYGNQEEDLLRAA